MIHVHDCKSALINAHGFEPGIKNKAIQHIKSNAGYGGGRVGDACGGTLVDTGEVVSKDEFDVEINVIRRRHYYKIYG